MLDSASEVRWAVKLVITIDTEEDNWGSYSPTDYTLGNIERIPELQRLFDDFYVTPTYLITYPVATDEKAVTILSSIYEKGRCEIGAHCHPWNTPPFEEERNRQNSMLCNLSIDLQYRKMAILHNVIRRHLGIEAACFRTGRWGFSRDIAGNLERLGYKIDTSITPYIDWTSKHGPDFTNISPRPFRFSGDDSFQESVDGNLVEVPATIGFLQSNFTWSNYVFQTVRQSPFNRLRLTGLLYRLTLVNKVWLSPEVSSLKKMIRLTQRMIENGYPLINMVFHSSSLKAGLTPFVKTKDDEKRFFQNIKEYLAFTRHTGIESIKLSDTLKLL
jgi:hypothetical protein